MVSAVWSRLDRLWDLISEEKSTVRGGFEPPVPLPVQRFSKAPLSTAQPPHRNLRWERYISRTVDVNRNLWPGNFTPPKQAKFPMQTFFSIEPDLQI